MININHLKLAYGQNTILDIDNLCLNGPKFYSIVGPSGCGKTSLINIISGINRHYNGNVEVDGVDLKMMNEKKRLEYRQKTISISYQDNVIFDDLTVLDNMLIKLEFFPFLTIKRKVIHIEALLKRLKIMYLKEKKAKYLSGGEKARLSIARTLVSDAKILIFDEPTASLDEENSRLVFSLLKEYAQKKLVIVVTHNQDLAHAFSDQVINLKYGKITEITIKNQISLDIKVPSLNTKVAQQPQTKSLLGLALSIFKSRKTRNLLASSIYTLSLTAICTLLVITTSVSEGIKSSFALNFNNQTALVSFDKVKPYPHRSGLNYEQSAMIAKKYDCDFGSLYLGDLGYLFPDLNKVYLETERIKMELPSFNINHFNLVTQMTEIDLFSLYGYRKTNLLLDEIILQLPMSDTRIIYEHLNLRKGYTLERLGEYLKEHEVNISINLANAAWQYDDEHIFKLVAVVEGEEARIIHSNLKFQEILFEDKLQFRHSYSYTTPDEYPWTLKKLHYLFNEDNDQILFEEALSDNILLSRMSYMQLMTNNAIPFNVNNRLALYQKPANYFPLNKIRNYEDLTLLVNGGLTTISEALMVGFSDNFLIGISEAQMEDIISYDEKKTIDDAGAVIFGPKLHNGHIGLSLTDGVSFNPKPQLLVGESARKLDEIVISRHLFKDLFSTNFNKNELYHLYVSAPNQVEIRGEYVFKNYQVVKLKVTGVSESERKVISHHHLWPLLFFKDVIKLDPFVAIPVGVISNQGEVVNVFLDHKDFNIEYPYLEFSKSIDDSLSQLTNVIYIVAISSIILAFIVLFLVLFTIIDDFYAHLSLLYLFGMSKISIFKIGLVCVGVIVLTGLASSLMTTALIELFIARVIFTNGLLFSNVKPYFITIIISLIGLIPSAFLLCFRIISLKIMKISKVYL